MKRTIQLLLVLVLLAITFTAIHEVQTDKNQLRLKEIKIKNIHKDLESLESDYNTLDKTKQEEIDKLRKREQELEKQLEARRLLKQQEAKAYAAEQEKSKQRASVSVTAKTGGSCESWMKQAGVPITTATRTLILKESGCNPTVWNKAGSGAYGIPQALPRTKLLDPAQCGGSDGYTNPVTQLKWMQCYVERRYGSWDNALAMWYSRCGTPKGCWY